MQRKTLDILKQKRHLCLLLSADLSTSYVFVPEDLVNKSFSEQRNKPTWTGMGLKGKQIRCPRWLCRKPSLDAAKCSQSFMLELNSI